MYYMDFVRSWTEKVNNTYATYNKLPSPILGELDPL